MPQVADTLGKKFLKVSLLSREVGWGAVCHWLAEGTELRHREQAGGGAALRLAKERQPNREVWIAFKDIWAQMAFQ